MVTCPGAFIPAFRASNMCRVLIGSNIISVLVEIGQSRQWFWLLDTRLKRLSVNTELIPSAIYQLGNKLID